MTRAVVKVTGETSNTYEDLTNVLSQRIGSLSNGDGDGDGNKNGKSNIFRLVKEQLYMCITLFCHFTCLYRYRTIPFSRFIELGYCPLEFKFCVAFPVPSVAVVVA